MTPAGSTIIAALLNSTWQSRPRRWISLWTTGAFTALQATSASPRRACMPRLSNASASAASMGAASMGAARTCRPTSPSEYSSVFGDDGVEPRIDIRERHAQLRHDPSRDEHHAGPAAGDSRRASSASSSGRSPSVSVPS